MQQSARELPAHRTGSKLQGVALGAPQGVEVRIRTAHRVRLFLDYDGTLADFAPTPEHIHPDPGIIALVTRLADHPHIRPAVISGRRLNQVKQLLPVPQVLLAGTYGVELLLPSGERVDRVPYHDVRPALEQVKPQWRTLIARRDGFFLEDKGWALAIHARDAADDEAEQVLSIARRIATKAAESDLFRVLGGHKFLEIGPPLAHKGKTVDYLLERYPWPESVPVYVGDDDKDEEAFSVVHAHDGIAIRVCDRSCETEADARLSSPEEVRAWLARVVSQLGAPRRNTRDELNNRPEAR